MKQCLIYLWVLRKDVVNESFVARTQGAAAAAHTWKRRDRAGQRGRILTKVPLVKNISLDSTGKPGKSTGHQAHDIPEFCSKKNPRKKVTAERQGTGW